MPQTEVNRETVQKPGMQDPAESRPLRRLLNGTEAGVYLGVSSTTVRRLYYYGAFPALRFGTKLRYDLSDLDAFIAREKARSE
jgi:excisionase family DNA binding protein